MSAQPALRPVLAMIRQRKGLPTVIAWCAACDAQHQHSEAELDREQKCAAGPYRIEPIYYSGLTLAMLRRRALTEARRKR